jgi:hypothetical protein
VKKAPCPLLHCGTLAASVHRLPIVKSEPRQPQGSGSARPRPRPDQLHRRSQAGVTKPSKGASRRPPSLGARRPTRHEFLAARKHASAAKGARSASLHRAPPPQGRTPLLGPRVASRPRDLRVPARLRHDHDLTGFLPRLRFARCASGHGSVPSIGFRFAGSRVAASVHRQPLVKPEPQRPRGPGLSSGSTGKPWLTLPPTLDSWDILVPADAPARLAGLW